MSALEKGTNPPYQDLNLASGMDPFPLWNCLGKGWDLITDRQRSYYRFQDKKFLSEDPWIITVDLHSRDVEVSRKGYKTSIRASKVRIWDSRVEFHSAADGLVLTIAPAGVFSAESSFERRFPIGKR
ncbi:MAG: hypothetical protein AAB801_02835 [Patescibacteria group bacterium]